MTGLLCIFLNEQNCTHWESETIVCCPSIDLGRIQLELTFYYEDVFGSVAYCDVVKIQGSVYSELRHLMMLLIFILKWVTTMILPCRIPSLVVEVRESEYNMNLEVSLSEKVAQEAW